MINAEKHKKELRKLNELNKLGISALRKDKGTFGNCSDIGCKNCVFDDYESCGYARIKWMLSEDKESLKVSKLEFDILLYLYHNTKFRYIARDEGMWLFAYYESPVKCTDNWQGGKCYETLDIFSNLFKFVKWSDDQPTSIKDVLDNCEVIENDTK